VNVGASFGNVKTDFNVAPFTFTSAVTGSFSTFSSGSFSDTSFPDGFMGGGQIGYNWQFSPIWVVGFETDFQGALEKDSTNLSNVLNLNPILQGGGAHGNTVTATGFTDYTTKIEWFGTVRLRAGYVWGNGNVFSYVTGGFAYGKVDFEGTNTVSGTLHTVSGVPLSFSTNSAFGHNAVNTGWVVGYGTEGRLALTNWTWRIEGFWMDLGHLDTAGVTGSTVEAVPPGFLPVSLAGGPVTTHSHFTDGILRGGLNYKFY
jgi:outer membrane immunogenic protein